MLAEGVLEDEKLVIEVVLGRDTILVLYGLLPHAHELPLLELTEETVSLDVVVAIALDEPLAEREELLRDLVLVLGDALARKSVVLVSSIGVGGHLEIVRITTVVML